MNNKQKKILQALFDPKAAKNILWKDIETLFKALGVEKIEGEGSRVKFVYNDCILALHKPHKPLNLKLYQIHDIKIFLEKIGKNYTDIV